MISEQSLPVWDHEYEVKVEGRSPYRWSLKSQRAIEEGDRFWLPLHPSIPDDQTWVRPIWKPRQSPNFLHVEVDRVFEQQLILRCI